MGIAKQVGIGVATSVVTQGLGLGAFVVISRWLSPEQVGVYVLVMLVNSFVASLANLGIGLSNTVFLSRKEYTVSQVNSASIFFSVALGGLSLVIFALAYRVLRNGVLRGVNPTYAFVAMGLLPFSLYAMYWNAMMVGLNRIYELNKVTLIVEGTRNLADIVVVVLGYGIPGLVGVFAACQVLGCGYMLTMVAREERLSVSLDRRLLREAIAFGVRGYLGRMASMIWLRLNQFVLNAYHGADAVGLYSRAVSITEKLWTILKPVQNAVNAKISGGEREEAGQLTTRVTRHVAFLLTGFAVALFFGGELAVRLLCGVEYVAAALPLKILLVGTIAIGVAMVTSIYFVGQLKRPGLLSILAWINAVINVALCFALIPKHGAVGAALASSVTYVAGLAIELVIFSRITGYSFRHMLVIKRNDFRDYTGVMARMRAKLLPQATA